MQVTVPVPHPGAIINQPLMSELVKRGLFAGIKPFASLVAFSDEGGTGIPGRHDAARAAKIPKYYISLAKHGIFIDGSLSLDSEYASAFSDESFSIYSTTLANFYRGRIIAKDPEFKTIPRLVIRDLPDYDKLNFDLDEGKDADVLRAGRTVTNVEQAWSFGFLLLDPTGPYEKDGQKFRPTFPSNHGLKYENGRPVVFDYQKYGEAFPINTTVSVGGGTGAAVKALVRAGQATAFLQAAGMAAFGGNHEVAAAKVIADFLEVK